MAEDILDQVWDPTPAELDSIYEQAGKKYGINPALLKAQNLYEVGPHGNARTAGDKDHVGYGQLGPAYRKKYGVTDPTDARQAIPAQAAVMRELLDKHEWKLPATLTEYTGGPDPKAWGPHTQSYASQVLKNFPQDASPRYAPNELPGGQNEDVLDSIWADEHKDEVRAGHGLAPQQHASVAPTFPWSQGSSFMNALEMGFGPEEHGAAAAAKGLVQRLMGGSSLGDAWSGAKGQYTAERNNARASHEAYANDPTHAGANLVAELAGGTIPAVVALAAGNAYGVEPLAESLGTAAPRLSPVLDFVTGNLAKNPTWKSWLARRASNVITGGASGAAVGLMQSHMHPDESAWDQMARGAEVGAIMTPALTPMVEKALTSISPFVARSAQRLRDLGVDEIRTGDIEGASPILRMLQKGFGGNAERAREQLVTAAGRTVGLDTKQLTSGHLNAAEARMRKGFEGFAGMLQDTDMSKDKFLHHDIRGILDDAALPENKIDDLGLQKLHDTVKLMLEGKLNGTSYLKLTQRGGILDRLSSNPDIREHALQLHDVLNDSLERHVASGLGRWVEGAPQPPQSNIAGLLTGQGPAPKQIGVGMPGGVDLLNKPNFTLGHGVPATRPYSPNFTGPGISPPMEGELEHGPYPPPKPGMTWEYDPGAQGLVHTLKTLRAQWKNAKILSPLVDDTTGQLSPKALSAAIERGFKRSSRAKPYGPALDMMGLKGAGDFIKDKNAPGIMSRLWDHLSTGGKSAAGGALGAAGLLGAKELINEVPGITGNLDPIIMGLLGAAAVGGAGKATNALANSKAATARALALALQGGESDPTSWVHLMTAPTVHIANTPEKKKAKAR